MLMSGRLSAPGTIRRTVFAGSAIAMALIGSTAPTSAQQIPDPDYNPPISAPEYGRGQGPIVGIDEGHRNFHTLDGGYSTFGTLVERDGWAVKGVTGTFSEESLERVDILVIANATHEQSRDAWAPLPNFSAFTTAEIAAVERWVRQGGSLLLIADHMPLAGHAERLAAAFGVRFYNGFALDPAGRGRITFRSSDGSLAPSSATVGRNTTEKVDSVTTYTGQGFRTDPGVDVTPILVLPEGTWILLPRVAWEFGDDTPRVPGTNLLQGALIRHGAGRLAVMGEAAMFTAQLAGPQRIPVGMNEPLASQNYRLALNVIRWLGGRLD